MSICRIDTEQEEEKYFHMHGTVSSLFFLFFVFLLLLKKVFSLFSCFFKIQNVDKIRYNNLKKIQKNISSKKDLILSANATFLNYTIKIIAFILFYISHLKSKIFLSVSFPILFLGQSCLL